MSETTTLIQVSGGLTRHLAYCVPCGNIIGAITYAIRDLDAAQRKVESLVEMLRAHTSTEEAIG